MPNINLSLPRSWQQLTTEQLEAVARIFIDAARNYTLTGQYSDIDILTRAFFTLSGLEVISLPKHDDLTPVPDDSSSVSADADEDPSHTYYVCQFADAKVREQRQTINGQIVPIHIYLSEIMAMAVGSIDQKAIEAYLKELARHYKRLDAGKQSDEPKPPTPIGPLSWLFTPSTVLVFPYPTITLPDPKAPKPKRSVLGGASSKLSTVTLTAPDELMQNVKWQQYRFLTDYMTFLTQCENQLVSLQKQLAKAVAKQAKLAAKSKNPSMRPDAHMEQLTNQIAEQQVLVNDMRSQFLATLFNRPVKHINPETGLAETTPHFVTTQSQDNAYLFKDFPEEKFQTISFWWQGMMLYLKKHFPKVFRREKPGKAGSDDNPFTLYTRSTTTMIKYAAANEEEVNNTTYTIILQHINDMADENDRIEEMKKK